ncbi:MAG TPA: GNAT family N-acetyltransferase [Usitatibacteraceae bacterium]|jgi:ribosomal protein S18 acetylase RimI-like enzyme|nr:GNAT family N-acetyltransferase [Usitatibacteraceae bacterium]
MNRPALLPVRLRSTDRAALAAHFLALDAADRRLRFGASLSDDAVRRLEERIDFDRDELFAIADDELRLLAVVHVAFYPHKAELGLSVLPCARGRGLGNALFERAVTHLVNRGVREVFVHCLSENGAMMHLARKHGMRVVTEGGETDAHLELPQATPGTVFLEWLQERQADAVQQIRRQARAARGMMEILSGAARRQRPRTRLRAP